jgi:hypothetical protein
VYVGGDFISFGSTPVLRNHIAALDATSGAPTAWDPNANDRVRSLAVSGSTVYAGGSFTSFGSTPVSRNYIAAVNADPSSENFGKPTAWDPNADDLVRSLAVSGSTVYVGGYFASIGGQTRNGIAAIDANGVATAWDPNMSGYPNALAVSESTVYAGGQFFAIANEPLSHFTRIRR